MGNTLKYIFEADATQLTATFKNVVNQVSDLVSNMNEQSVDWESILTGTLSPAIIASIAASFAIAISSALQFQDYMTQLGNTSNTAATNTAGGIQGVASTIDDLSDTTGESTQDMAQAWQLVSGQLQGATAQFLLLAGTMGQMDHIPLLTLVQELNPLMQNFGITTIPQVNAAMQGLQAALTTGNISNINTLISDIASAGPGLGQSGASIGDIAATVEGMTKIMPTSDVVSILQKIGASATDNLSMMNLLLGGNGQFNKIAADIKSSGLEGVYDDLFNHLKTGSETAAQVLGKEMGLSTTEVDAFRGIAVPDMAAVVTSIKAVQTAGANPLIPGSDADLSNLQLMGKIWNDIKNDLQEIVTGSGFSDWFHGILTDADKLLTNPIWDTLKDLTKSTGNLLMSAGTAVSETANTLGGGAPDAITNGVANAGKDIGNFISQELGKLFGSSSTGINPSLSGSLAGQMQNQSQASANNTSNNTSHTVVNNFNVGASATSSATGAVSKSQSALSYMGVFGL